MRQFLGTPDAPVSPPKASRRQVLGIGATLVGGALVVGGCSPSMIGKAMAIGAKHDFGAFGPFIKVGADGAVTVVSKHIELGQGNHAGLAAIVAEELDADWDKVKVEQAPANASVYANSSFGMQGTGGSSAISNSWMQLRNAGAATRAMFVQAAASKWSVPASEITVQNGVVGHKSGRQAHFGELVEAAAKIKPPQKPVLKDPKTFTLVGSDRVKRKDSALKATGTARFTQDVHLPGMLTAMVAHAPKFGATVASFDATAARKVPGVVDVVQIPTGVAVIAQNTYAARQGRDALSVKWDESKAETRSTDQMRAEWSALAAATDLKAKWYAFGAKGDPKAAAGGAAALETTYDFPYLAHASMEPMNCVAIVSGNSCKLVSGSQIPTLDQLNAAKVVGTLPGMVEVETLFAGGSFGRRANFTSDYATEAVQIAKHVGHGRAVKLVWTREDDMQAGHYRPLTHHAVRVTVDKDGFPATWRHRIVVQSLQKGSPLGGGGLDPSAVEGAKDSPYLKATPVVDAQAAHRIRRSPASGGARWGRPTPPSSWSTPSTSWPTAPARTR
jgi:isoquinoline 1-oxidoreductase beta subunit